MLALLLFVAAQDEYTSHSGWTRVVDSNRRIQGNTDLPRSVREEFGSDFRELENEIAALEKRRLGYRSRTSDYLREKDPYDKDLAKYTADNAAYIRANDAHSALANHECPCAEYNRLFAWWTKVSDWKKKLDEQHQSLLRTWNANEKTRKELDADVAAFWPSLGLFVDSVEQAEQAAARIREHRAALRRELEKLRGQVADTQEALRRLIRAIEENNDELETWAKTSDESLRRSYDVLGSQMIDGLSALFSRVKEAHLDQLDRDLLRAKRRRNPGQVAELQREREGVLAGEEFLKKLEKWKGRLEAGFKWTEEDATAREAFLETVYQAANEALQSEKVQKVLRIGGAYAGLASAAKAVVDSSFELETQWRSYLRISQLGRNSDEFLKAVKSLSDRMKRIVDRIVEIKREIGE